MMRSGDSDSRWTTRHLRAVCVYDGRGYLGEGLRANERADADDSLSRGAQPRLIPPGRGGLGHATQAGAHLDAEPRIPG